MLTLFNVLLIAGIFLLAIFFRNALGRVDKAFQSIDRRVFLAVVFLFALINTVCIFKYRILTFPQGGDDYAYLFQAKLLAKGKLWVPSHPLKEFFQTDYIINNAGKTYAQYTLGAPLFLALGILVDAPWLVNPLLGALSLIILFFIAVRFFDEGIARYGIILVGISTFVSGLNANYTSHSCSMFFMTLFLLFFLKTIEEESWFYPIISGFFWGVAINTRMLTAFSLALPFWIWGINRLIREDKNKIKPMALFLAGSFLPLMGLMFVNNLQNGGPLIFGHKVYNGPRKTFGFSNEYTLIDAIGTYLFRWRTIFQKLISSLFSPAIVLILLLFSFGGTWRKRKLIWWALLSISLLYLPVVSNIWQARYYLIPVTLLIFLVVLGLRNLGIWLGRKFQGIKPDSLALLFVVFCLFYHVKTFSLDPIWYMSGWTKIYTIPKKMGIKNAVIFVKGVRVFYPNWYCRNSPDYDDDILYVLDRGEENRKLMNYYPNRSYYRYDRGYLTPIGRMEVPISQSRNSVIPQTPHSLWEKE